ncbi:MAG: hypothetical protein EOO15_13010 [Chitinophagaceae bacterium]|nr:MAG: hypothetical protein EOO15_13010 [Chitinophagaceae bacterium]
MTVRTCILLILVLFCRDVSAQKKLSPTEARDYLAKTVNVQLLDFRAKERYASSRIAGAQNITLKDTGFLRKVKAIPKTTPLLVYGKGNEESRDGAEKLARMGYRNVRWIEGGIRDWYDSELPLEGAQRLGMSVAQFDSLVARNDVVLVAFHADWCGYCPPVMEYAEDLGKANAPALRLLVIDTDENPDIRDHLNMYRLPALILYQVQRPVWLQVGYLAKAVLEFKVRAGLREQLLSIELPTKRKNAD